MSNFAPTVGRPVQYVDNAGALNAAIITAVHSDGSVDLVVFTSIFAGNPNVVMFIASVKQSRDEQMSARQQVGRYIMNWQGR